MKALLMALGLVLWFASGAAAVPLVDCVVFQDGGLARVSLSDQGGPTLAPTVHDHGDGWAVVVGVLLQDWSVGTIRTRIYLVDDLVVDTTRNLIADVSGDGRVFYMASADLPFECCYSPQPMRLAVDVSGLDERAYGWSVVQPVPEPSSVLLLLTGLVSFRRLV